MSELADMLRNESRPSKAKRKHDWVPTVFYRNGVPKPVLLCKRQRCPVKWWPDRFEPKSECKGW